MTKLRDRYKNDIYTLYSKDRVSVDEIAKMYGVSRKTMYNWLKHWGMLATKSYPEVEL